MNVVGAVLVFLFWAVKYCEDFRRVMLLPVKCKSKTCCFVIVFVHEREPMARCLSFDSVSLFYVSW